MGSRLAEVLTTATQVDAEVCVVSLMTMFKIDFEGGRWLKARRIGGFSGPMTQSG